MMASSEIYKKLSGKIQGKVYQDIFSRIAFSTDASIYRIMPLAVAQPASHSDVVEIVRFAGENKIPIVPRGAGSGLAGEALGSGIVIDFTALMNKIISISQDSLYVVCQPGVVLDDLNNFLSAYGRKIGPDPSSGNRAVVGGVVANNATGAHSLQYGYIAEHIKSIKGVLADGTEVVFDEDTPYKYSPLTQKCYEILTQNKQTIESNLPKTKRNRSGYNIGGICRDDKINIPALLAGSEGTLAVFTEITLKTVPVAKHKGLIQFAFDSIEKTALAVPSIIQTGAAACEMMDGKLNKIILDNLSHYADLLPSKAAAILLVEHIASDENELRGQIEKTIAAVEQLSFETRQIFDSQQQKRLWKSRKDAVPLLFRDKSNKKPIPFIEDVSVDNTRLAEYVCGLDIIFKKYNVDCAYYGHAGDGELHIRPYLDLTESADLKKMQDIANDVFELAWQLGGTISGEHADGLVRAAFIKKQYGSEFYEILRQIKNIFDPDNILNPGKITNDDPDIMIKNMKLQKVISADRMQTNLNFDKDEFRLEIEQCNGDGVCRSMQAGQRMCPVFGAVGSELACSRAKANLMQAWIIGLLEKADFTSDEFKRILGLCINCKMCSVQCPSGVDISKLILEARAEYVKHKGLTITERFLIGNRYISILGAMFVPLSNIFLSLAFFRVILQKISGIDQRRQLPKFQRSNFIKKINKYLKDQPELKNPIERVVYFTDTYVNYNDHQLGFAVVKVLRHNNIEVVVPPQRPAPLPAIVYGDIKTAKRDLQFIVDRLSPFIEQGYKIVCSEPSAALCLKEDLRLFIDSPAAVSVSNAAVELMDYLKIIKETGGLAKCANRINEKFVYHTPCHIFAMDSDGNGVQLLKDIAGIDIVVLDCSCCGLAGTCGMQNKNFDLSIKIGQDMADKINNSNADFAMTECSACKMQIEQMTNKIAVHPIKVLARVYGLVQ